MVEKGSEKKNLNPKPYSLKPKYFDLAKPWIVQIWTKELDGGEKGPRKKTLNPKSQSLNPEHLELINKP